jgi:hypothetical protein
MSLTVPQSIVRQLAVYLDALDIDIISQYSSETLFGELEVHFLVKITGNEIPEALKEEKLREKFGKYIKHEGE